MNSVQNDSVLDALDLLKKFYVENMQNQKNTERNLKNKVEMLELEVSKFKTLFRQTYTLLDKYKSEYDAAQKKLKRKHDEISTTDDSNNSNTELIQSMEKKRRKLLGAFQETTSTSSSTSSSSTQSSTPVLSTSPKDAKVTQNSNSSQTPVDMKNQIVVNIDEDSGESVEDNNDNTNINARENNNNNNNNSNTIDNMKLKPKNYKISSQIPSTQNSSTQTTALSSQQISTPSSSSTTNKTFKYQEDPIRKKDERAKIKGRECEHCAKFYDAIDADKIFDRKKFVVESSRHKHLHSPPKTPPNFWDLDFPSQIDPVKHHSHDHDHDHGHEHDHDHDHDHDHHLDHDHDEHHHHHHHHHDHKSDENRKDDLDFFGDNKKKYNNSSNQDVNSSYEQVHIDDEPAVATAATTSSSTTTTTTTTSRSSEGNSRVSLFKKLLGKNGSDLDREIDLDNSPSS
eukprot:TRINITY_DN2628_c0_g1_i1.p1 TRINITY_DN2628_c0_g1~~TRINITY_DN2628_c0_g1_i1.p1  ORF type:complete len:455 (-),score=146.83 TRINITY_DN2628_c0_g1_i1:231-1595(-)